jgi:hypothetical protein
MAIRRKKAAEVIDISPLTCARCSDYVELGDVFCRRCGHALLEGSGEHPAAPAPANASEERPAREGRGRSRAVVASIVVAVLLIVGAGYAGWTTFVRPGVGTFDEDVRMVLSLTAAVQEDQDALGDPSGLPEFVGEVDEAIQSLRTVGTSASAIESERYRSAAVTLVGSAEAYLKELTRLATLPAAEINDAQYRRSEELAAAVSDALAAAAALRDLDVTTGGYSPSSLTRVLADLAAYRAQVLKQRARIIAANKVRAERLNEVRAFTSQMDGIVARYTAARSELSEWIDGVDTYGATFDEAYQVLEEQTDRRRQLRSELAALPAPPQFAAAKQSLLAVMDQAVAATEAAYRGIGEYQWDFDFRYLSYDETPGWRTFQSQTGAISDRYADVLATYSARKDDVIGRLSTKTPLPRVPR